MANDQADTEGGAGILNESPPEVVADQIPSPTLVKSGSTASEALIDLLGLRLPVQSIGTRLLNGLTVATPTVRYFSLRTWLLHRYGTAEPAPPDSWSTFLDYAKHAEAAFVLANLIREPATLGLIGSDKGNRKLREAGDPIPLEELTKQAAATAFGGPSDQLRLTRSNPPHLPVIGQELGLPLVEATESSLGETRIGRRLRSTEPLPQAWRSELEEFGAVAWVHDIPEAEREALIQALIPLDPEPDAHPRVMTYAALLALASPKAPGTGSDFSGEALLDEAVRADRVTPVILHSVLDEWLLYAVRDAVAVTGEASLALLLGTLQNLDPNKLGVEEDRVVRRALEDATGDMALILMELGLSPGGEDLGALSFRELKGRVAALTPPVRELNGFQWWRGPLMEPTLYRAVAGARGGVLALGILSWILAERRTGDAVRSGHPAADPLSAGGDARFGLRQMILPRLGEWERRSVDVLEAVADYCYLILDQHLQVVWRRMAADPGKDPSIFHRDGSEIRWTAHYKGGRADTRIEIAVSWLHQLRLLEDGRTTARGLHLLEDLTRDSP